MPTTAYATPLAALAADLDRNPALLRGRLVEGGYPPPPSGVTFAASDLPPKLRALMEEGAVPLYEHEGRVHIRIDEERVTLHPTSKHYGGGGRAPDVEGIWWRVEVHPPLPPTVRTWARRLPVGLVGPDGGEVLSLSEEVHHHPDGSVEVSTAAPEVVRVQYPGVGRVANVTDLDGRSWRITLA